MANFYTILTVAGKAAIANATVTGVPINFTQMAVGDGNGTNYSPVETQSSLIKEVWRGNISSVSGDENNPNHIVFEAVIPATQGGFYVREIGLYDDKGTLLAIGNCAETYKPRLEEGSTKDLYLKVIIVVSNTSVVTLKVDPSIIMASKKYVDDKVTIVTSSIQQVTNNLSGLQETVTEHLADNVNHVRYAVATGTANTYAITLNPAPTAYVEGMALSIKINVASTGPSTLNANGLGAKGIKKSNGTDVTNLKANGIYTLRYDGVNFILQGEGGSGNAAASDLLAGKTASTDAGDIVGTMPNRGVFNLGLGVTVPEGYYSGGTTAHGKRWASGVANSIVAESYTLTTNTTSSSYGIEVTGLDFLPSIIVITSTLDDTFSLYRTNGVPYQKVVTTLNNFNGSTATGNGREIKADVLPAYVNNGGFKLPVQGSGSFNWVAYE